VHEEVTKRIKSDRFQVFCVWTPAFPSDGQTLAREGAAIMRDPREKNYWDARSELGTVFGPVVKLPGNKQFAFDVYFVYPGGVRWEGARPPAPVDWMHQILDDDRFLDGKRLREMVQRQLDLLPPARAVRER
jgi:hypothetical protein